LPEFPSRVERRPIVLILSRDGLSPLPIKPGSPSPEATVALFFKPNITPPGTATSFGQIIYVLTAVERGGFVL
jgi:hypothetical protein